MSEKLVLEYDYNETKDIFSSFNTTEKEIVKIVVSSMKPKYKSFTQAVMVQLNTGELSANNLLALATWAVKNLSNELVTKNIGVFHKN